MHTDSKIMAKVAYNTSTHSTLLNTKLRSLLDSLKSKVESRDHDHDYNTEHHDAYLVGRDTTATAVEPVVALKQLVVSSRHDEAILNHWMTSSAQHGLIRPSPIQLPTAKRSIKGHVPNSTEPSLELRRSPSFAFLHLR